MVDRQTPTVKSDDEMARQAEAVREVSTEPADGQVGQADPALDAQARRRAADDQAAAGAADAGRDTASSNGAAETALFDRDAAKDFQERWLVIQTEFVDAPGEAVKKAEALVGEVVGQLTEGFARERASLEGHLSGNDDVSTEDLRQAIRRYRSFFNRLLAI
jgi:hypothetical protein